MALSEIEATCTACGARQRGTPKRSFFGFQKLTCRHCSAQFLYPLTEGYKNFYWLIVTLGVISAVMILGQGEFPLPSIWLLLVSIALFKNAAIKKKVEVAEAKAPTQATNPGEKIP